MEFCRNIEVQNDIFSKLPFFILMDFPFFLAGDKKPRFCIINLDYDSFFQIVSRIIDNPDIHKKYGVFDFLHSGK